MRLAARNALIASSAFLIVTGTFAIWAERQLDALASALMEGTARLLGSELAATLSDSAVGQLLQADPAARLRLEQMVSDLTAHSEVVASIAVVDAAGRVVASKDLEIGRQLAIPPIIFQGDKRVQFVNDKDAREGGKYYLFAPLMREGNIVGYFRLSMGSSRITQLYHQARRQLLFIAAIGLALVGFMGLLFQVQVSRVAGRLTRTLEAAVRGEVLPAREDQNEFAQALEAARRVGKELNAARDQRADAQRDFGGLMKVMDVGVAMVGPDNALDLANDSARLLLGYPGSGELERHWPTIQPLLAKALEGLQTGGGRVDLDLPADGNRLRLELYPRDDRAGWLMLVKSREMLDALENELRLAIQMRGFARFYMAFAHDLKAPLNAMVLNLELLRKTLPDDASRDADEATRGRQTKYIRAIVEEVSRLDRYLQTVLTHATPPSETRNQFDLRELIEDLGTLLSPQAKRQRVSFAITLPDHAVPFTGHRDRLKQALLNITINGLESMPQGGTMEIQMTDENGRASVAIRDSGPGIPSELREEIYKLHFTTKERGTGIGLHVARSVVEAHGGAIRVESEMGHGTCFYVDLPAAAA